MVEVTFYQAVASLMSAFGLGLAFGYKLTPVITQDKAMCNELATNPKNNGKWKKTLQIGRIFKNGKCVNVSCPYFNAQTLKCHLTDSKCLFIA